jgi:hypothetical protein
VTESATRLIIVGGPLDGQEFPIEDGGECTLGSDAACSPRLELGNVAPTHARLSWSGGRLVLADSGSATGTFVNGEQLVGERAIEEGDRICLGPPGSGQTAKILVRLGAPTPVSPSALAASAAAESPDVLHFGNEEPVSLVPVADEQDLGLVLPPLPSQPEPPTVLTSPAPPPPPTSEPEIVALSELEIALSPAASATAPTASVASPPAPAPKVAPAPGPARSALPDYQTALPSIGGDSRPRPRPSAPRAVPRPQPRRRRLAVPRIVILGAVLGLACLAAVLAYVFLRQAVPALKSAPAKADVGALIALEGTDFAADAAGNTVRIGDSIAVVKQASPTRLSVEVPEMAAARASVTVEVRGVKSNALTLQVAAVPRVLTVIPDVALPGQEVTLTGTRLASGGAAPVVIINNVPAEVLDSKPETLRIRVPAMPADDGQVVPVTVRVGDDSAKPVNLTLGRLPLVVSMTPTRGLPGDRVTLRGRGFAADPGANVVTIAGQAALVLKAQPTELTVLVPAAPSANDAPVVVRVGDSSSATRLMAIDTRSMATYVPRFFAAGLSEHAGHGHVLVSTEVAPVLVLSDKGEASSTVERAEQLATALNALVETQLRGENVSFECRETSNAVGVVGSKAALVTVTAQDAAAYGETWDPGVRSASVTPKAVARYWAALLQDYFTLFLAHQRPTRVVELSPRGRVLLDLYTESARRSGPGNGVPSSLVFSPGAMLSKGLRDMALLLPSGAAVARAGTAVEGLWVGKVRDGDTTRPVQLSIRSEAGRLTGTLTVSKGGLDIRAPLSNVAYENGALRFTVRVGGEERYFDGKLQGDQLSGSIRAGSANGATAGEFTLRFTD